MTRSYTVGTIATIFTPLPCRAAGMGISSNGTWLLTPVMLLYAEMCAEEEGILQFCGYDSTYMLRCVCAGQWICVLSSGAQTARLVPNASHAPVRGQCGLRLDEPAKPQHSHVQHSEKDDTRHCTCDQGDISAFSSEQQPAYRLTAPLLRAAHGCMR